MRLVAVLAAAAFIAALSLVAAPGSAGSRPLTRPAGVDPALLQPLLASRADAASGASDSAEWSFADAMGIEQPVERGAKPPLTADSWAVLPPAMLQSVTPPTRTPSSTLAGRIDAWEAGPVLVAEGLRPLPSSGPPPRPIVDAPNPVLHDVIVLRGIASWYDNGTTAMRWPRGARIRICGPGGCVNRVVTDWGPDLRLHPDRVVDLMPVDFVRVCGCSLRIGLTRVTVQILG